MRYDAALLTSTVLSVVIAVFVPGPAGAAPAPKDTPAGLPQSVVAPDYQIGPGDTLQVYVWRNPELTASVAVRPDGKISTPLVENMVAVGKTPSQLARDVEAVLGEYVRQPTVNVIVTTAMSFYSQVKIVGQVRTPQAIAYREGLKVLDVMLVVGGLTDYAAPNRARIVRMEGAKQIEIKVRLGDLLTKGDLRQNLALKPGDVLVVPESLL